MHFDSSFFSANSMQKIKTQKYLFSRVFQDSKVDRSASSNICQILIKNKKEYKPKWKQKFVVRAGNNLLLIDQLFSY